jgi:hypothetical protein
MYGMTPKCPEMQRAGWASACQAGTAKQPISPRFHSGLTWPWRMSAADLSENFVLNGIKTPDKKPLSSKPAEAGSPRGAVFGKF